MAVLATANTEYVRGCVEKKVREILSSPLGLVTFNYKAHLFEKKKSLLFGLKKRLISRKSLGFLEICFKPILRLSESL